PAYAPAPIAMYNWTGFYVGGQVGGGWASSQATNVTGTTNFPAGYVHNTISSSGVLGGVYGGYNYQINQFVIGIDGDYSWADLKGSGTDLSPTGNGTYSQINDKVSWIATVTGRLGYAMNNWLLFVKGGGAWAGFSSTAGGYFATGVLANTSTSASDRSGWTIGTGVEWGFLPHWSAKLEYDYVKFSTANYNN